MSPAAASVVWDIVPLPAESPYRLLSFGQLQVQVQVAPINARNLRIHLDAQTAQLRDAMEIRRTTPAKVVVLVDGSVALMPPAEARHLQADWVMQNKELLALVTHKMGFVLPNPLLRAFVSAVFLVAPLPIPMSTHASMHDAIGWAMRELAEIGGEVDPKVQLDGVRAIDEAKQRALAA